ncbi:hypothetical protein [Methanothermobacter tenebrarum]|uniref:hypothetical protein n=1 Tax=Methanothermobacter tenebrarum TaxID=680118 RepID=UPI001FEAAEA6|nr:hypothetical protein [Methanothermobacter tenebrarum]
MSPSNASYIVVGDSYIKVSPRERVVTQVDRVIRDRASNYNLDVPPDHRPRDPSEVVPWMEGARIRELMKYANITVIPATNVTVKKINGSYFAPDDKGNFVFEVDVSKLGRLNSIRIDENTWKEIDTHGMNVLVPTAIEENASLVVGCGDHPGKAKAEAYLAEHGIDCYAPCDRFTSNIMPYKGPGTILGSAPIRPLKDGEGAIIGAQPIYFSVDEKIVVQTTTRAYPDQYCDTPYRYFTSLERKYGIDLDLVVVDANAGEAYKVVDKARETGAKIIGVRVLNEKDKKPVEEWLREDRSHRAILFHSAAYEPGYSLFFEFPYQVAGQDPNPKFIGNISDSQIQEIFDKIRSLWGG